MDPKKPNLREALEPARKSIKEAGEKVREALAPAKEQMKKASDQIRESLGLTPRGQRYEISRVSGKTHTHAGDPDFATLDDAVEWAKQASKGKTERFDVVTKDANGIWTTVKQVFNGVATDPPA